MNPFLKAPVRMSAPAVLDGKTVLGYIEHQALPLANRVAEGAEALHAARPTPATLRRAQSLRSKAKALTQSAVLHRKKLSLSGLLDDYMKDWEDFRARHQPPQSTYGKAPEGPFFSRPAQPLPTPEPPSTVRYFPPVGASDRYRFCQILKAFDKTGRFSEATTDAVSAFKALLATYPKDQWDNIIEYIETYCPMPDFFYNLVGVKKRAPSTPPYVSPGRPVPTVDIYPPKQAVPQVPPYVPPTAPPVPSIYIPPRVMEPAPVQMPTPTITAPSAPAPTTSVTTETGMAPQCPPEQFWDGRRCRGSVTTLPFIPGGPVATVSPSGFTGPGITMGIVPMPKNGCRSGTCRPGGRR